MLRHERLPWRLAHSCSCTASFIMVCCVDACQCLIVISNAVVDDHHFKDEPLFYRFRQDDGSAITDKDMRATIMLGVRIYHISRHIVPSLVSDHVCGRVLYLITVPSVDVFSDCPPSKVPEYIPRL